MEHPLIYLGANKSYITLMNQIGTSLKSTDIKRAIDFRIIVRKIGIDYYKDDYEGVNRRYPNLLPGRVNPSSYLKF